MVGEREEAEVIPEAPVGRVHPGHVGHEEPVRLQGYRGAPGRHQPAADLMHEERGAAVAPPRGERRTGHHGVVDLLGKAVKQGRTEELQLPGVEIAGRPEDPVVVDADVLDHEGLAVDRHAFEATSRQGIRRLPGLAQAGVRQQLRDRRTDGDAKEPGGRLHGRFSQRPLPPPPSRPSGPHPTGPRTRRCRGRSCRRSPG